MCQHKQYTILMFKNKNCLFSTYQLPTNLTILNNMQNSQKSNSQALINHPQFFKS